MEDVHAFPTSELIKRMAKECQVPENSTLQVVETIFDITQEFLPICGGC